MSEFDVHQTFLKIYQLIKNPELADGLAEKLSNAYAIGDEQKAKLDEAMQTIAHAEQAKIDIENRQKELDEVADLQDSFAKKFQSDRDNFSAIANVRMANLDHRESELGVRESAVSAKEESFNSREKNIDTREKLASDKESELAAREADVAERESNLRQAASLVK